jgi:hypothetical protein
MSNFTHGTLFGNWNVLKGIDLWKCDLNRTHVGF